MFENHVSTYTCQCVLITDSGGHLPCEIQLWTSIGILWNFGSTHYCSRISFVTRLCVHDIHGVARRVIGDCLIMLTITMKFQFLFHGSC